MKYFNTQANKSVTKIEWLFLLFVIGIISSGWLRYIHPFFLYVDDIFAIVVILFAIFKSFFFIRWKFNKYEKSLIKLYILLFITGIFGNFSSNYQTNLFAVFVDILAWTKLFLVLPCMGILINYKKGNKYYEIVLKYVKLLVLIIFSLVILNLILHLELVDSKYDRFGIPAFAFGSHPTFTGAISCAFLSLFLFDYRKNIVWIILCCIIAIATLRFKSFAYISLIIMMIMFVGNKIRLKWRDFVIAAILCIIVVYDQISYYFFNPDASRIVLVRTSLNLARVFFPIGSGYATFGTMASGQYYSKIYDIYGLSDKWGFSLDAYSFIGDGGFSSVMGQFGIIGFAIIIYMIFIAYKSIVIYRSANLNILPVLSVFSYLLIAGSSELSIASDYSILFAYCLTLIANKYKYEKYKLTKVVEIN
jgi:hypothetical protein